MPSKLRRLIGNREFYAMVLAVVMPIIVQNAITNFVNLLDNLMVGRIGTDQMSGVAIANQLVFVFSLTIFGAVSGAGIFTAQFHGAGNPEGVRASFRYKLYACLFLTTAALILFLCAGPKLVSLYLNDTSDPERISRTLDFAMQYLHIMLLGLLPFALTQCYAGTLRETGETAMPMFASILAVLVNLSFNYLLIFGKLGFPCLGVRGAAIATVLSRYVELVFIVVYTHTHRQKHPFAEGLYRTLRIPLRLTRDITTKGMPLLANELLWSLGTATLTQIYSMRGLDVVAAMNITSTMFNLFAVAYHSMGSAAAIIVGRELGANAVDTAKDYAAKLMTFAVAISLFFGGLLLSLSHCIPLLYNTSASVHSLATSLLRVVACSMPFGSLVHCAYFILRSGGKTGVTFLFDCVFMWTINMPVAFVLAHFTGMGIVGIFLCVQLMEGIKAIIGSILVHKGIWIHNIVSD